MHGLRDDHALAPQPARRPTLCHQASSCKSWPAPCASANCASCHAQRLRISGQSLQRDLDQARPVHAPPRARALSAARRGTARAPPPARHSRRPILLETARSAVTAARVSASSKGANHASSAGLVAALHRQRTLPRRRQHQVEGQNLADDRRTPQAARARRRPGSWRRTAPRGPAPCAHACPRCRGCRASASADSARATAPPAAGCSCPPWRPRAAPPARTRCGSPAHRAHRARGGMAPTTSPGASAVGKSFRLCTARSMAPVRSAASSSAVNRPLPPNSGSGVSSTLSPCVRSTSISNCRSGQAACNRPPHGRSASVPAPTHACPGAGVPAYLPVQSCPFPFRAPSTPSRPAFSPAFNPLPAQTTPAARAHRPHRCRWPPVP